MDTYGLHEVMENAGLTAFNLASRVSRPHSIALMNFMLTTPPCRLLEAGSLAASSLARRLADAPLSLRGCTATTTLVPAISDTVATRHLAPILLWS